MPTKRYLVTLAAAGRNALDSQARAGKRAARPLCGAGGVPDALRLRATHWPVAGGAAGAAGTTLYFCMARKLVPNSLVMVSTRAIC